MISDRFKFLAEQRVAQDQKSRRIGKASVKDLHGAENDLIDTDHPEQVTAEDFSVDLADEQRAAAVARAIVPPLRQGTACTLSFQYLQIAYSSFKLLD